LALAVGPTNHSFQDRHRFVTALSQFGHRPSLNKNAFVSEEVRELSGRLLWPLNLQSARVGDFRAPVRRPDDGSKDVWFGVGGGATDLPCATRVDHEQAAVRVLR
jgi:hypothetical protein